MSDTQNRSDQIRSEPYQNAELKSEPNGTKEQDDLTAVVIKWT
jgi:hypothetical protein